MPVQQHFKPDACWKEKRLFAKIILVPCSIENTSFNSSQWVSKVGRGSVLRLVAQSWFHSISASILEIQINMDFYWDTNKRNRKHAFHAHSQSKTVWASWLPALVPRVSWRSAHAQIQASHWSHLHRLVDTSSRGPSQRDELAKPISKSGVMKMRATFRKWDCRQPEVRFQWTMYADKSIKRNQIKCDVLDVT